MPRTLPKPLTAMKRLEMLVPIWHTNYLKQQVQYGQDGSMGDLQEVMSCASFMGIGSLVLLASAKIATLMQGCRNVDQVRQLLGIENDFSPQVYERLASGQIGLWDTRDEEKERSILKKKQDDAEEAIKDLINLTMAESQGALLQQSFSKHN